MEMKTKMKKKLAIATLSMAMLTAWAATSHGDGLERSIGAKDVSSVHVKTFYNVKVETWASDQIKIKSDNGKVSIEVKAGTLQVDSSFDGGEHIQINMPKTLKLSIRTINGDVGVKGLENKVDISCVNGNVQVQDCANTVNVETVDGDLTVRNTRGDLSLQTVSGNLSGENMTAVRLEAKAVSGDIKLSNVSADHVSLASHSGNIVYEGTIAQNGDLRAKCFSGDLAIYLPTLKGFELSAKTRSGNVKVEHNIQASERSDNSVTGRFGTGGPDITLASFSGDIVIGTGLKKAP